VQDVIPAKCHILPALLAPFASKYGGKPVVLLGGRRVGIGREDPVPFASLVGRWQQLKPRFQRALYGHMSGRETKN
jgi:hypothetical protein